MAKRSNTSGAIDPARLAVFESLATSIAEEMGATLRHTALSPNIKERADYSCAVFDAGGRLLAQAAHIPGAPGRDAGVGGSGGGSWRRGRRATSQS